MVENDKKFVAGLQDPAQPALKPDIAGIRVVLRQICQRNEGRKRVIQPIDQQGGIKIPFFQPDPVLFKMNRRT